MSSVRRSIVLTIVRLLKILGVSVPPIPTVSSLIVQNEKLLMLNLSYKDGFALPGGGVDSGENFEIALKRELYEELSVRISSLKYFGTTVAHKPSYTTVHVCYIVRLPKDKIVKESTEGIPVWIDLSDAYHKCIYEDQKEMISKYTSTYT